MKKELTPVEVIGLAVKREQQAHDFYEIFASKIKNSLVKAKYLSLAEEEIKHKILLIELYQQMIGDKKSPPIIPGEDANLDEVIPTNDIEELLKLAISKEEDARKFYLDAAVKMHSQSSRRLLEYLADMERGHALVLKTEQDAYFRDKNWYSDNPDVQLVGP